MKRLIALLLIPAFALADPSAATRYLMNEPASLMDIGLLNARSHLDMATKLIESSYDETDPNLIVVTYFEYHFDDDLFVLSLNVISSRDKKFRCEDLITRYSNILKNLMIEWFSHDGYVRRDVPDDLEAELLRRIELRCSADGAEGRRRLLDSNFYWMEN